MAQKRSERILALEERLETLRAQERQANQRRLTFESRKKRKEDTRRKILVGSLVLARVQQGRFSEAELRSWLDEALTRSDDRALFELPPSPADHSQHQVSGTGDKI